MIYNFFVQKRTKFFKTIFSCEASLYKLKYHGLTGGPLAILTFIATCRPLIQKLIFQNIPHLFQRIQNWFSKQEMELFLPFPGLWSKNFFYKMSLICSKWFIIDFQNRNWNYPNRKWNYFSHCQASDQKTSFIKCLLFVPSGSKLIFKTGNGIIQTGNGIISPTSRPLIKKLLLQDVSLLF